MKEEPQKIRRWDPLVKLTHWGIVAAVMANALFTGEGSGMHIWVGYGLAGLLAMRLLWGLIGPAEARFTAFPPNPVRALRHIGDIVAGKVTHHQSHNPLGAMMVYAIWATLACIIVSGIAMSGPPPVDPFARGGEAHEGRGAKSEEAEEARGESDEGEEEHEGGEGEEEMMEEWHEAAVNLLYLLIALHLAGVLFETRRMGKTVVGAMIPGGNRRGG